MPVRYRSIMWIMAAGIWTAPASTLAQEDQGPQDPNQLTIGAGGGIVPSYEGSDNSRIIPGGFVRGRIAGFGFFTRGAALYVDAIPDRDPSGFDIEAGPVLSARFNRTGGIKDDRVKALGKLDSAWELGGWAGIAKTGVITSAYDNLSFRVAYVHDVAGAHGSYVITPAIEYGTPLSPTTYVGLSLSANYVGKGYGRYYFDIDSAGSAASGLAPYGAAGRKAGFSRYDIGLLAAKSLSGDLRKGWALVGGAAYGRLLGRYGDSPIVADAGRRSQWMGGLGIAYTF